MTGTGNRSDDGCGDMRCLMAEWAGKSERRVTSPGQAIARLFFSV